MIWPFVLWSVLLVVLLGWGADKDGNGEDVALWCFARLGQFGQKIVVVFHTSTASCIPQRTSTRIFWWRQSGEGEDFSMSVANSVLLFICLCVYIVCSLSATVLCCSYRLIDKKYRQYKLYSCTHVKLFLKKITSSEQLCVWWSIYWDGNDTFLIDLWTTEDGYRMW